MKKNFILISILFLCMNSFSQEKSTEVTKIDVAVEQPENGKVEDGVYTCYRFDWKIKIPLNYVITDVKAIEELERKSYEANKDKTVKQNRPHLIGFGLDTRNNFSSTFEPLTGTQVAASLEEHKKFMIQLLNDTYSKIETLKYDISSSDMKLGNYDFYTIQTRLYDAKTDELLLTQVLYNSFINNSLFSVSINYNNPNMGKLMTENFISSFSN